MGASIRIIKIMKDRNPVSGEEQELYTVEFECEAEEAKDLARELTSCPLGQKVLDLLDRAEFLPEEKPKTVDEMRKEAEAEEAELKKREEELREEGRKEVRKKYVEYLRTKHKTVAADTLEKLAEEEEAEAEKAEEDDTEPQYHSTM